MRSTAVGSSARFSSVSGGCYRVQVLVVGRHKVWRDEAAAQVRRVGCQATVCDRGVDAMTVLALGLPVDVLIVDASLQGSLCGSRLAVEARAVRPNLRIVFASDADSLGDGRVDLIPDILTIERDRLTGDEMVDTVRDMLARRLS